MSRSLPTAASRQTAAAGRRDRVRAALDAIDSDQLLVLALLMVEDLNVDEAAHLLALSPRNVRALCDRAMTQLRRAMHTAAPRRALRVPSAEVDRLALRRAM